MLNMGRVAKWHIYDVEHGPLCWDDQALEFDFAEDAYDFLRGVDEDLLEDCVVVQDILFYDGGYINATNLRIVDDELVRMEDRPMAKVMSWEKAAKFCEETFGTYVDWEERFFICPECDDPVYECDFPDHGWYTCPVCETYWEDVE